MGLAFLAKLSPVILVPYFLLRRHLARWLPAAVALVVLGFLPFAGAGDKLWASLGTYGRTWYFNSFVYQLLAQVWSNPDGIRLLLAAAVAAFSFFQACREQNLARFAFRVIACALLLSPTVYPWYVTWVVPFLCIFPSRAWLYFSGAVMMSYVVWIQVGAGDDWRLGIGFLAMEYIPFYVILIMEFLRWRKVRA